MPASELSVLDSSALAKRYIDEAGQEVVRSLFAAPEIRVTISRLAQLELHSAFARRVRTGELTVKEAAAASDLYELDSVRDYRIVLIDETTLSLAERLVGRHPLRAADAVHVATAIRAGSRLPPGVGLRFYTGDRQQAAAAQAEGLDVLFVGAA